MSQVNIVPLDTAQLIDETAVGSKAASLIRLGRIGLSVPAGFCITENALQGHLEQNNLTKRIKSTVDELANTKPDTKTAILSALREAIVKAPLSQETHRQIENHYRKLGADHIAVRSSGTAADVP